MISKPLKDAVESEEAFQAALEKQFGKKNAIEARYSYAMQREYNDETKTAWEAKERAGGVLLKSIRGES